ncbi:MAG: FKBP-type peptidyl-prolyl cis-trans isomerase [Acidimicrobiales bacterium]
MTSTDPAGDLGITGVVDAVVIARGPSTAVYRAFRPASGTDVAVKVLEVPAPDDAARAAFRRECEAIGRLAGVTDIVAVQESGTTTGLPYLIMAYCGLGSLATRLDASGPLPWREAVAMGVKLARALHAAHEVGVVHGDLTPASVLIADDGEPHLSLRIAAGEPLTPADDVYALGSTLSALMGGYLPDALTQVIAEAMAADPADRPASAAIFADRLEAALGAVGADTVARPVRQRRPGVWIAAVAASAVMIVVLAALLRPDGAGTDGAAPASPAPASDRPCVSVSEPLPAGAPAVPVETGAPPGQLVTRDLRVGSGAEVTPDATVTVAYVGVACSTGAVFDSSYAKNQPATFALGNVIDGWREGIPGMRVGGRRMLGIPPDKAYGAKGAPPVIGPGETLWFVVDLLDTRSA